MSDILLVKTRFSTALKNKNKRAQRHENLPLNKPLFAFAVVMG